MSCGQISVCDLYHKCGIITADQIKSSHTTPVQILQSFGSGTCIIIVCLCMELRPQTTSYTNGGDLILYIGDQDILNLLTFNIIENNKNIFHFRLPYDMQDYDTSILENKGVYLRNVGNAYEGGDSIIHFNIAFGVMPMHKSNI